MTITETELHALVGHRFTGGRYRIEHSENWLLTDCTGCEPLPDALVHPVALFHVPILGVGTSITELFALGHASGAGSVGLEGYDCIAFQIELFDRDQLVARVTNRWQFRRKLR